MGFVDALSLLCGDAFHGARVVRNQWEVQTWKDGQIVRTKVAEISVVGRNTQGVRCIALNDGDKLVSVARIPREEPVAPEAAATDTK